MLVHVGVEVDPPRRDVKAPRVVLLSCVETAGILHSGDGDINISGLIMRGMHFINRLMVDEPRLQILSHGQYFPVADGNVACPDDARSRVEESPAEDQ